MGKNKENDVPATSIDEALKLFISMMYPNGLPEGEEGQQLLRELKDKIAKDRPHWAKAGNEEGQTSDPVPGNDAPKGYAGVKAKIVEQANQEQIPEDPNERYYYFRDKEAKENREQRKAEDREQQIREDMINRLKAQKNGEEATSLEKVLQIRKALETSFRQNLPSPKPLNQTEENNTGKEKKSKSGMLVPRFVQQFSQHSPNEKAGVTPEQLKLENSSDISSNKQGLRNRDQSQFDQMDNQFKIDLIRQFAKTSRANLASRDSFRGSRRPSKPFEKENRLSTDSDEVIDKMDLDSDNKKKNDSRDLDISDSLETNHKRLKLE